MPRRAIVGLVSVAVILGAMIWLAVRPRSDAAKERDEAGWRVCATCGYEWHMSVSKAVAQSKKNPKGTGWVRCPKCGAWDGRPGMLCPKCGKRFPISLAERNEEYVLICPHCGYAPPRASLGGNETPPEGEEAGETDQPETQ